MYMAMAISCKAHQNGKRLFYLLIPTTVIATLNRIDATVVGRYVCHWPIWYDHKAKKDQTK